MKALLVFLAIFSVPAMANIHCKSKLTVAITDIKTQTKDELTFDMRVLKNVEFDQTQGKCDYKLMSEHTLTFKPNKEKAVITDTPTEISIEETSKLTEKGFIAVKTWKVL